MVSGMQAGDVVVVQTVGGEIRADHGDAVLGKRLGSMLGLLGADTKADHGDERVVVLLALLHQLAD
jgi:hypothetical protein